MSVELAWLHPERANALLDALSKRILVLDGAMGTMVQSYRLAEEDYRGERFACGFDRSTSRRATHRSSPAATSRATTIC